MIVLIQRVKSARVEVDQNTIGSIQQGLLAFVGFEPDDDSKKLGRMLERVVNYRVFADTEDKMNLSLTDIQGELLLIPQFTLAADTERGRRPSFTSAADPQTGCKLFSEMRQLSADLQLKVAHGEFGADMQVYLQNDGPVTFILKQ
jgi:D-aminoacyl-tRNA deacylase